MQDSHPTAFASRSLSSAEVKYAQIEKEMLAIVFALTRFDEFIYGTHVEIQSDHKPLISIVQKDINKVSARLQRMLLKILKYDFNLVYVPGKQLVAADALSRAFIIENADVIITNEIPYHIHELNNIENCEKNLTNYIPIPKEAVQDIIDHTKADPNLSNVKQYLRDGWPCKTKMNDAIKSFYKVRSDLQIEGELLFLNNKLIVPETLREKYLKLLHISHQGMEKTKLRARQLP